jgi:hypothetical protein
LGALERGDQDLFVAPNFIKFGWVTAPEFQFEVWGYHCTKTVRGEDSALAPSFVGAALGADHRAESIGKIRDSKGKKVEDSNTRLLYLAEVQRARVRGLLQ